MAASMVDFNPATDSFQSLIVLKNKLLAADYAEVDRVQSRLNPPALLPVLMQSEYWMENILIQAVIAANHDLLHEVFQDWTRFDPSIGKTPNFWSHIPPLRYNVLLFEATLRGISRNLLYKPNGVSRYLPVLLSQRLVNSLVLSTRPESACQEDQLVERISKISYFPGTMYDGGCTAVWGFVGTIFNRVWESSSYRERWYEARILPQDGWKIFCYVLCKDTIEMKLTDVPEASVRHLKESSTLGEACDRLYELTSPSVHRKSIQRLLGQRLQSHYRAYCQSRISNAATILQSTLLVPDVAQLIVAYCIADTKRMRALQAPPRRNRAERKLYLRSCSKKQSSHRSPQLPLSLRPVVSLGRLAVLIGECDQLAWTCLQGVDAESNADSSMDMPDTCNSAREFRDRESSNVIFLSAVVVKLQKQSLDIHQLCRHHKAGQQSHMKSSLLNCLQRLVCGIENWVKHPVPESAGCVSILKSWLPELPLPEKTQATIQELGRQVAAVYADQHPVSVEMLEELMDAGQWNKATSAIVHGWLEVPSVAGKEGVLNDMFEVLIDYFRTEPKASALRFSSDNPMVLGRQSWYYFLTHVVFLWFEYGVKRAPLENVRSDVRQLLLTLRTLFSTWLARIVAHGTLGSMEELNRELAVEFASCILLLNSSTDLDYYDVSYDRQVHAYIQQLTRWYAIYKPNTITTLQDAPSTRNTEPTIYVPGTSYGFYPGLPVKAVAAGQEDEVTFRHHSYHTNLVCGHLFALWTKQRVSALFRTTSILDHAMNHSLASSPFLYKRMFLPFDCSSRDWVKPAQSALRRNGYVWLHNAFNPTRELPGLTNANFSVSRAGALMARINGDEVEVVEGMADAQAIQQELRESGVLQFATSTSSGLHATLMQLCSTNKLHLFPREKFFRSKATGGFTAPHADYYAYQANGLLFRPGVLASKANAALNDEPRSEADMDVDDGNDEDSNPCQICHLTGEEAEIERGTELLCDLCDRAYHPQCLPCPPTFCQEEWHCPACINEGSLNVYTAWIPLQDIPSPDHGVLCMKAKSHLGTGFDDTYAGQSFGLPKLSHHFDGPGDVCPWMIPVVVNLGDILVFNVKTIHAATINHGKDARLSFDLRFSDGKHISVSQRL